MSRKLVRRIYNILFAVGFALSAPYYFWKMWRRGSWRRGFGQRFGRYDGKLKHSLTNRHVIWFHAVSVGEVNLCTQLIRSLETRAPNLKVVVSTTTSTGMGELEQRLPSHIQKIYYPLDLAACTSRALSTLHPEAVVLVEAEIWPNFLWKLKERRIPGFLVNARLSARSLAGYRRFGFLFRPVFGSLVGVGAQSAEDAAHLEELGCDPAAIRVLGSLKFDAAVVEERKVLDVPGLLTRLGVRPGAPVVVAGSTHDGEERLLAEIAARLRGEFPGLFLVLVPRHFERGKEVGRVLAQTGTRFVYRNQITPETRLGEGATDCLLVNTTGELKLFYRHATVIFVGKSLTAHGGQNPIEPGALGKAMVFGPHMENFQAIAAAFVEAGGAVQVKDAAGLEEALGTLLRDGGRREALGQAARGVVEQNRGGIERTLDMILGSMDPKTLAGTGVG